jgi:hypothetical protein
LPANSVLALIMLGLAGYLVACWHGRWDFSTQTPEQYAHELAVQLDHGDVAAAERMLPPPEQPWAPDAAMQAAIKGAHVRVISVRTRSGKRWVPRITTATAQLEWTVAGQAPLHLAATMRATALRGLRQGTGGRAVRWVTSHWGHAADMDRPGCGVPRSRGDARRGRLHAGLEY